MIPATETFVDFMRKTIGPHWVIARRTPRVVRQYGENVICVSPKRYAALRTEYDATQADPKRDAIKAMLAALGRLSSWNENVNGNGLQLQAICDAAEAAIAEAKSAGIPAGSRPIAVAVTLSSHPHQTVGDLKMPFDQQEFESEVLRAADGPPGGLVPAHNRMGDAAELMATPAHMLAWLRAKHPDDIVARDMGDSIGCLGSTFLRESGHANAEWFVCSGKVAGRYIEIGIFNPITQAITHLCAADRTNVTAAEAIIAIEREMATPSPSSPA